MKNHRIYSMRFGSLYPAYVNKAERKERSKAEVDKIIMWLTGYDEANLEKAINGEQTVQDFFNQAPQMNPDRSMITGVVCGVRVEEVEEPLMREIRYLDKLIDELARGKALEKILRTPPSTAG